MLTNGFVTGVNYWASNAGIKMWSNFDEKAIDSDFAKIASLKMDIVRIFPLWSDFQPVYQLYGGCGQLVEVSFKDDVLPPDTEAGRAGVSEEMLERFNKVLRLAEKHGLKVAVGIVTGWMSGRLFVPPVLEGKPLTTDTTAVRMAMDFIRIIVTRFKDDPVIVGWTSGNETDCIYGASWPQHTVWATTMRNTIRAYDPHNRPIMDDMHPVRQFGTNVLNDRRDIFDVTTVHPYAYFSQYCRNEPIDSMRGLLHAVAEAKVYEGIEQIPCLIEEIGTLGDFLCSREVSAAYARTNLYSSWANGMTGMIWWCANEQVELKYPPYTWCPLERELGIFDENGEEKLVAKEFKEFKETISKLPFEITKPKNDAVCILGGDGSDWAKIIGSYVLSKQAGFNLSYAHQSSIPESDLYILPSVNSMPDGNRFEELLTRIERGATLVITFAAGLLFSKFEKLTGNKLIYNTIANSSAVIDGHTFRRDSKITLESKHSTVLMSEDDGNPFLTVSSYGKGKVIFCTAPIEKQFSETVGEPDTGLYEIYKIIAEYIDLSVKRTDKRLGITVHKLEDGTKIAVAVNYSGEEITDTVTIKDGSIGKVYLGNASGNVIIVKPYSATIFEIK
ncbi:MAG: cellulase family glycosylhydrolase [Clostridia bacterium]|nr:cellulase family glycosylhydrolase [Clostridia bacterium]